MTEPTPHRAPTGRLAVYFLILGIYLTLRGYHSRDGDQAYRLVLLLHRLDPTLYADDPFVRSFDAFNPHTGYLALLDLASRPLGLSAGLAVLFTLTFLATCAGVDRLARSCWPGRGDRVGIAAITLFLVAKAGNIGTNHLFEAMLLDRLMALALGWLAFALAIAEPRRGRWLSGPLVGLATWIHPSMGLQLALTLGAGWVSWGLFASTACTPRRWTLEGLATLTLAVVPGAARIAAQGSTLFEGMPADEFRLLAVTMQGPQHMVPGLWRFPQWLAWFSYLIAAGAAVARPGETREPVPMPTARARLLVLLGLILSGLAIAWVAIEVVGDLRITLFQPFRMATVARGLALVLLSGRVLDLWARRDLFSRCRAGLLVVGLSGDWAMVAAVGVELICSAVETIFGRSSPAVVVAGLLGLGYGIRFLTLHDTESGFIPIAAALAVVAASSLLGRVRPGSMRRPSFRVGMTLAWSLPVVACLLPLLPINASPSGRSAAEALAERWRFGDQPVGDLERLAAWCRDHTPTTARFIGPPGPKTFRLWARRSVTFNRASSPYHAAGLADWSARYREHVAFRGSTAEFVQAYLTDRHGLERRYQEMTDLERANLAHRQGATHVLAAAPGASDPTDGPLELLRVDGRYAVYRVRPEVASARDGGEINRPAR